MSVAEHGGVPGDLHFDVTEDAVVLESLLRVLKLALSPAARDGMAGQTDGLRWRVNREGEPIKVAFLGTEPFDWIARKWGSYSVEVPWKTAKNAILEERFGPSRSLELLATALELKKPPPISSSY